MLTRSDYPTFNTYPLQILLNNGHGRFVDGTAKLFEGPPPEVQVPRKVVLADFNNDGRTDIFVADTGYDHSPGPGFHNTLVLSTPDGELRDATSNLPAEPRFTHSATAADVNGDGSLDLYVGSIYTESHDAPPEILLNDGSGRFRECGDCLPALLSTPVELGGSLLHGPTYTGSQFVDVNSDGAPDLVLAGNGFYRVREGIVSSDSQVLLNDGRGHFSVLAGALPPRPWNNTAEGLDIKGADLNRDGSQDLVISYTPQEPYYVGRWLQILINQGNGIFRDETGTFLPQSDNSLTWITTLEITDLNGDGLPDVVAHPAAFFRAMPPFLVNQQGRALRPLPLAYTQTRGEQFAIVDTRGDGHRDFLTVAIGLSTFPRAPVSIVAETSRPEAPGTPSDIRAVRNPTDGKLVVAWPYDWGATRYEVWRSTNGGAKVKVGTTSRMNWADATATSGHSYTYSV